MQDFFENLMMFGMYLDGAKIFLYYDCTIRELEHKTGKLVIAESAPFRLVVYRCR